MGANPKNRQSKFNVGDRVTVQKDRQPEPVIGTVVTTSQRQPVCRRVDSRGGSMVVEAPGVDIRPDRSSILIEAHDDQVRKIARRKASDEKK